MGLDVFKLRAFNLDNGANEMTNKNLNDALEKANEPDQASTKVPESNEPDQASTEDLRVEDLSDEDLDDVAGGCGAQCGVKVGKQSY
jgi:hypothetical protein